MMQTMSNRTDDSMEPDTSSRVVGRLDLGGGDRLQHGGYGRCRPAPASDGRTPVAR